MGKLGDLLSAGVGLAAEAINSKRQDSQQQQVQQRQRQVPRQTLQKPPPSPAYGLNRAQAGYGGYDDDDRYDEYGLPPRYTYEDEYNPTRRDLAMPYPTQRFPDQPVGRLPYPVIIPQRRPESQTRGWMLAYAPVLENFGIDQATFLKFIYDFNESYKTSPYLDAVNLAAFGVGFVPGITPIAVSLGVTMAVTYAKKYQSKKHSKSYIGRMNAELFEPRGLYAVIMTLQPTTQASVEVNSETSEVVGNLNYNTTTTTPELPESAPLVFPSQAELAALRPQGNKLKEMGHLTADYLDRRAQAKYAQKNPNSALAVQNVQFSSSFGDPRNNRSSSSRRETTDKRSRRETPQTPERGNLIGNIKNKVGATPGVLYLMIAEKPSEEDMNMINNYTLRSPDAPFSAPQSGPRPFARSNDMYRPAQRPMGVDYPYNHMGGRRDMRTSANRRQ